MTKLLYGVVALVVLLVAALFVGPSLIDWNSQKAVLTAQVKRATGRDLMIAGDMSLSILPAPALSASGVSLANIEGGSSPAMVDIEELRVRVALFPLLQGRIEVESVALVEPYIVLDVLADGRRNWVFSPDGAGAPEPDTTGAEPAAAEDGFAERIRFDRFAVEGGTIVYREASTGEEERIEQLDATIVAESFKGPFSVKGMARMRGMPAEVELALGRVVEDGATPVNGALRLAEQGAEAQFSGTFSLHADSLALRGGLKGGGDNLARLVALAAREPEGALPPLIANPFSFSAAISGDQQAVSVEDVMLRLGDTTLDGSASLQLQPRPAAQVKLQAAQLDLDRLLAAAEAPPESGSAAAAQAAPQESRSGDAAPADGPATLFGLPADVKGDLQLAIDALVYRGQVIRQLRVQATHDEGRLTIDRALALLPGGSDLSLTGALSATEAGPQFEGRIEGASDNLRAVLTWLGADVAAVPADRLRKTSFGTRLTASPTRVTLSDLDLRFDVSRLQGGVVVALRERIGMGIGLSLDKINLDAYLATAASADSQGEAAAPSGDPSGLLQAFDANFDLRVGAMVLRGTSVESIHLDGTLQAGQLTFREARVDNLAGSALKYAGAVGSPEADPLLDGTIELRVADPQRLAKLAGLAGNGLAKIGPFNLNGNVRASPDSVAFNARAAALGGDFALDGTLNPLDLSLPFDVVVQARHPDLAGLVNRLAEGRRLGAGLGALNASARLSGTRQQIRIADLAGAVGPVRPTGALSLNLADGQPSLVAADLAVTLTHPNLARLAGALGADLPLGEGFGGIDMEGRVSGGAAALQLSQLKGRVGPMGLDGAVTADLSGASPAVSQMDLRFNLSHGDLAQLAASLGRAGTVPAGFGGIELSGQLLGNPQRIEARGLQGRIGPGDLSGTVVADLSGAKPALAVDLSTGPLPLAAFIGGSAQGGASGGAGGGSVSRRWSREPFDLAGLQALDADVTLRSTAFLYQELRLDNADLKARLRSGAIDVERLSGKLYQGDLQISGTVAGGGDLTMELDIRAAGLRLGQLLRQQADFDRVSGPVSLDARVNGRGASEAELVSRLTGNGRFNGEIAVQAKAEEQLGAALLGLLGTQIREVRGLRDTTASLLGAFTGSPSRLQGTFRIDRGVLSTDDTRLDGREATAFTRGNADFAAWLLDLRTDVYRNANPDRPFVGVHMTGAIDSPNQRIEGDFLREADEPAEQQQPSVLPGVEGVPDLERLEDIKPKDVIKDLLRGLGN